MFNCKLWEIVLKPTVVLSLIQIEINGRYLRVGASLYSLALICSYSSAALMERINVLTETSLEVENVYWIV